MHPVHEAIPSPALHGLRSAVPTHHTHRPGFTIVEILAVIFIIVLVLAITFPVVSAFRDSGKNASGVTTVSTAVDVARAYATNKIRPDLNSAGLTPITGAEYSGTAALFTPAGQVRLVENDQFAVDPAGLRIESDFAARTEAFEDIADLDFITLTSGVGVVGVRRVGGTLELLPPPFAITFNEQGVMTTEPQTIIYDSNGDGDYDTTDDRAGVPGGYNPNDWDRDSEDVQNLPNGDIKRELPFERVEVVTAVIVFDLDAFYDEFDPGTNWPANDNAAGGRNEWILDNGRPLIFSRATGVAFQDEGDGN